jgi:hypothetical protein
MTTKPKPHQRGFRIVEFRNRTNSLSYRVTGWLRGRRIRENHGSIGSAEARKLELEGDRLGNQTAEVLRATWLTPEQLRAAEWAAYRLPEPEEVRRAVDWWLKSGKALASSAERSNGIQLDDALAKFKAYLDAAQDIREATRRNLKSRVGVFVLEVGNLMVAQVSPEIIEDWIHKRTAPKPGVTAVSAVTADNDRRAISRFFSWCAARPQRFVTTNPVREVHIAKPEMGPPEIYSLREVMRLLAAARRLKGGKFLKGVVLQLFGCMRPFEAARFTDDQLVDGLVRIEATQSKTGRARTFEADPVLKAWLAVAGKGPVADPFNSRLLWDKLRRMAKLKRWIHDGLRHTGVSHFFRRCGSYGLTAEMAGNSESVIKRHYAARTSISESAAFWSLYPSREARRAARLQLAALSEPEKPGRKTAKRKQSGNVVPFPASAAA